MLVFAILAAVVGLISCDCQNPVGESKVYTTTNLPLATETAFVIEFKSQCTDSKLSAVLGSEVLPVYTTPAGLSMISVVKTHKDLPADSYSVDIYDESGIVAYKTFLKEGGDAPKPLQSVAVSHPGVSKEGLPIQSEFIVMVAYLLVWWFANTVKSKISE